ncbi:hypothetical protein GSI_09792 [Ganoderma sinense ZZ0214-1]|uniref:Fungal-type protein kinase domain-containing protein n=1 Tax=Ganoderma sinense ZZ0214-1 TaxID=1077348 RepID=A0A2G8S309_9APHY|nr:hypothetical protein GSI_09792 [Ganoderma sinense ZZ0214-1]
MSLSTKEISSSCFCHCCSDTYQEGVLVEGWKKELRHHFIIDKASGAEFVRKYAPSSAASPPPGDIKKTLAKFERWKPQKGHEADSYPDLLTALGSLVSLFPADKRPDFMDCHKIKQYFPFTAFAKNHHSTFPDIAISFPGKKLDSDSSPDWFGFSGIMVAKAEGNDDPFKKKGLMHCRTLVQLAVNARNLMHAHGLTCTFVLGIYGTVLRICRFDHSGAIICQPLRLNNVEDLKVIRQFFWNFVHPTEEGPFVGWDPTMRRLSPEDEKWLQDRLRIAKVHVDTNKFPLSEARSLQIFDGEDESGREPQTLIAFKILDVNGRLFSRATTVWHAIRDTRRLVNGRLIDTPVSPDDLRVRVIKEAWRQIVRRPEKEFYDRLGSAIAPNERKGLPNLLCGGDLGEREVRLWESALYGAPAPISLNGGHHKSRLSAPTTQRSVATPPPSLSATSSSLKRPVHRPMQQTFVWRRGKGANYWHRERSHMRFVVAEVGRPVTQFRNTKELVMAFRDAIIGHRTAMTRGGVLHRDISVGNILIVDDPAMQDQGCGFIHDFDYSSMSRNVPHGDISSLSAEAVDDLLVADDTEGLLKERTGTFLFMAIDLLGRNTRPVIHAIRHDLESFYWALLWVVIRHIDCRATSIDGLTRQETCAHVFKQDDGSIARMAKSDWMMNDAQGLEILHNPPFTFLMTKFSELVKEKSLTYDNVLSLFDAALAAGPWPEVDDDGPLEYIPPDMRTVNDFSSSETQSERHRRRRRKRAARAAKGKTRETTVEHGPDDSDDSDDDDEYDDPWESDAEIQPGRSQGENDAGSLNLDIGKAVSALRTAPLFNVEDLRDAAEVSMMLHGDDSDMEDVDIDPATLRSLRGMHLAPAPWEAGSSDVAECRAGQSHSGQGQPRSSHTGPGADDAGHCRRGQPS